VIRIATNLARHRTDRQRQAVVWEEGRHAVTRVRVAEAFGDQAALVECWLETGRTHQIRVHLAYAGHGLIGDQTYGGRRKVAEKAAGAGVANGFPRRTWRGWSGAFGEADGRMCPRWTELKYC
jgi:23S rRNA pseudouridine1911/1915/1917 synthase